MVLQDSFTRFCQRMFMERRYTFRLSLPILFQPLLLCVLVLRGIASSQSNPPEWINYTSGTTVRAIADDGQYLWVGGQGLTRFNKLTGQMTFYNKTNSGLPQNTIFSIVVDRRGNKWIVGGAGLTKFDGTNWITYTQTNSGLPSNITLVVALDTSDNVWIGTSFSGLVKFDGTTWTVYNTENSGIPGNTVAYLAIDVRNEKWLGVNPVYLARFDGSVWRVYTFENSGLPPDAGITSFAFDRFGYKWIGTTGGLARFDGATGWIVYTTANSGIPSDDLASLAID